ncbi:DegT/DnrJ/EryC1/StrS family aminotransferase [Saccharothrix sp. 6-C]|uniref:DegT/DnrJ/EryC1/StrS family aminotransferase n=1 Tax=Saccharothrix sp. 6-C TaxID=2781735 RepID=UPI001AF7E10B|nr:DegT/DnrJ/EryC1/StrS family aminotransferase [Saccharothrix sp. 6-C]QQQ80562.1 DegT/DnrJ/EryC1/StrS family aminotransferase [Saccharothrix sp. 6-C]
MARSSGHATPDGGAVATDLHADRRGSHRPAEHRRRAAPGAELALPAAPASPPRSWCSRHAFEEEFAARFGSPDAVAVDSGTAALYTSLLAADVGPGDEVVVASLSFVASASVAEVAERTKAIIVVHHLGFPADVNALVEIARRVGAVVIG